MHLFLHCIVQVDYPGTVFICFGLESSFANEPVTAKMLLASKVVNINTNDLVSRVAIFGIHNS